VKIPANDATVDKLREQQVTDDVERQYATLDKAYTEQAVVAPYGNEQYAPSSPTESTLNTPTAICCSTRTTRRYASSNALSR
jgi:hypothetical protein